MSGHQHTCMILGDGGRTVRAAMDRIRDKWTLLVVATLGESRLRFTDLYRRLPDISQRMLTLTLKNLERDGLVSRTAYAEVPPRVEYALTETGRSLIIPALTLAQWAIEHVGEMEASRTKYESRRTD
ncbi:winged helix-turn-helix transcriptional regulator [Streptomyces bauhiniae]|uniref:winged helix-turn-helix transcriptional regulator n=1 Tax=Streptomyces bauhiniae TaxID=2340725 RepID=UPI003664A01E